MKGTYGSSMTMISTRRPRPSNCKQCPSGRMVESDLYCMQYGNINPKRRLCRSYEGPKIETKKSIHRKDRKKNMCKTSKKR